MYSLAFPLYVKPNHYTQVFIHRSTVFLYIYNFVDLILAALSLCCCGERGYSPAVMHNLLISLASPVAKHGF